MSGGAGRPPDSSASRGGSAPNESLRRTLLGLIAEDDALRDALAAGGALFDGYHPRMEPLHRRNAARLRSIIARHGWPTRSLAGTDGAAAAWRIVQHAIGEPDFVRACLPLLRAAVRDGEADPGKLAMLEDRVRVFEGRAQLYGTQYDWDDGQQAMVPMGGIEDAENVDERRRSVGLPPIEWRRPPPSGEPPPSKSAEGRRAELEAWAREVGWRGRP